MKKVLLMFLALMGIFTFVACDGDQTDLPTGIEFLQAPDGLEIDGNVLRWDAVDNATAYRVYVGGVF